MTTKLTNLQNELQREIDFRQLLIDNHNNGYEICGSCLASFNANSQNEGYSPCCGKLGLNSLEEALDDLNLHIEMIKGEIEKLENLKKTDFAKPQTPSTKKNTDLHLEAPFSAQLPDYTVIPANSKKELRRKLRKAGFSIKDFTTNNGSDFHHKNFSL